MSRILLGADVETDKPVCLDVDRLIESRALVQGASGSGKSHTVRRILEQTFGHVQHLVFDVEGEYVTLRKEFDYVIAQPGGEVPAEVRSAEMLIRKLLQLGASAIIDLHDMRPDQRPEFIRRCMDTLVTTPRALWHDVLVVLEEAHLFAPQSGRDSTSTDSVIDLATRGRKRGFCLIAVTQRISDLHKSVVAQCSNRLIGKTTLDADVKRAAYELGFVGREEAHGLAKLHRGQFFGFGPAIGDAVHPIAVGETKTSAPSRGQRGAAPPPPTAKVLAVLAQLADLPKEAEAEARTLAEAKAENARLRRELAAKPVPAAPAAPKVRQIKVPVLSKTDRRAIMGFGREAHALVSKAEQLGERAAALLERATGLRATVEAVERNGTPAPVPASQNRPVIREVGAPARRAFTPPTAPARPSVARFDGPPAEGIAGPEQRILDALAKLEAVGNPDPEETAVATLAGYSARGGHFGNTKGALRGKGLVEVAGDRLRLTEAGRALARPSPAPASVDEMHAMALGLLDGPGQRVLKPVLDAYPAGITSEDLAAAAGFTATGGHFTNTRGRLRTLGLVDFARDGVVRARPFLFLEQGR